MAARSQPSHPFPNAMGRRNLNPKTQAALNTIKQNNHDLEMLDHSGADNGKNKQNEYESFNILERIQSKIEEKQSSRAETAQGITVEVARKQSSTLGHSAAGTKRCPNLQQLIDRKKHEEGQQH